MPIQESNPVTDTLGRPLADLRISLTDRCNFNCNYCMPNKPRDFLPKKELLSFEEIDRVVGITSHLGVRKVKLTGGEPLLRADIEQLIAKLRKHPQITDIGLITNGMFLKPFGPKLKEAGLDRVSVSLDALELSTFQKIIGNPYNVHNVLEGIEAAHQMGFSPIKINCVIQKGLNEDQILPLVQYFRRPGFHLRFIEFMDVGDIYWKQQKVITSREILDQIRSLYPLSPIDAEYYGEVALRYAHEGSNGEIGFISAVSQPFCRSCTRLRLSSNGKLYKCLFGSDALDIKELLRDGLDDRAISTEITRYWSQRDDQYSEQRLQLQDKPTRKAMNFMGG